MSNPTESNNPESSLVGIDSETTARGRALLDAAASDVEHWLDNWRGWDHLPEHLAKAGRYGVLGGGKRLRPALVLLACEACGGDRAAALPAAASVELVHCFSLVHDDLPALDDDALRRGQPTLHVHYGEAMAILAGDLLLAQSFQILASGDWPADVSASLVRLLADRTVAMVAGQVYDTLGGLPDNLDPAAQLTLIHRNKTGSLMQCAVAMGARVAHADSEQTAALDRYGDAVGIMFQIVDDLLDITQSEAHLGKAVGKDAQRGHPTWPGLLGTDASLAEVERLLAEAIAATDTFGAVGTDLRDLATTLAVRTR